MQLRKSDRTEKEPPDLIDLAETEIDRVLSVCHKQGLNYRELLRILLKMSLKLQMLADEE